MEAFGWTLARPLGLAALALPLALWILARVQRDPQRIAIGTLALWRRIPSASQRATGARRSLPWSVRLVLLALLVGTGALVGPRRLHRTPPRTWTIVCDLRPSLSLPAPGFSPGADGERSRADVLFEAAQDWLAANVSATDRVVWRSPGRRDDEGHTPPPSDWREPLAGAPSPDPEANDRPGVLLLLDLAPRPEPEHAGWIACGAEPVPGPVGIVAGEHWTWDGSALLSAGEAAPRRVWIDPASPEALVRVFEAWRAGRAHAAVDGFEAATDLAVLADGVAVDATGLVGRDGWWSEAGYSLAPAFRDSADAPWAWLWVESARDDDEGEGQPVLVRHGPGRIRHRLVTLSEPSGDPAAFAVSWSELFDRALRPAPGAVSVTERARAGPAARRDPEPPNAAPARAAAGATALEPWLVLATIALALLASFVRRAPTSGSSWKG